MKKLLLFSLLFSFLSCGEKTEQSEITRDSVLIEKAKEETMSRLKSPSTAKFVDSLSTVMRLKGEDGPSNSYRVMLSVDAQNTFGAEARERYMIILEDKGEDSLKVENYEVTMFN